MRRGSWRPGEFDYRLVIAFGVMIYLEALVRGLDYVTGDLPHTTSSLTFVEQAMPLWAWGILCIVAGGGSLVGLLGRWYPVLIGCALVGGASYFTLSLGLAAKAYERYGDGFRTPVMFLMFSLIWFCIAYGQMEKMTRANMIKEMISEEGDDE
jgi:hypothetical protein